MRRTLKRMKWTPSRGPSRPLTGKQSRFRHPPEPLSDDRWRRPPPGQRRRRTRNSLYHTSRLSIPVQGGERAMPSQADGIRRHALKHHVRPWRESGASTLSIRAGDVERGMGLRNRTPNVCSALEGRRFQQEAGLILIVNSTVP